VTKIVTTRIVASDTMPLAPRGEDTLPRDSGSFALPFGATADPWPDGTPSAIVMSR
jgi:hypothetical protein